ncbi:hypothetical protein H6P81_007529 [Aristolochia fimbriata]|uniref:Peptidase C19 ubiquitin carboxyl-terminal hydrolase domain-containing protein n=1 Tax=Aristolochia fimbriata TaxID=158543 RepID=A0AAV7F0I7_ARIFI|nr:hypothetical protein H6P81_007529 [Aristolochia fimbriata]
MHIITVLKLGIMSTSIYKRRRLSWLSSLRFTWEQVEQLDKNKQWSRALDGSDYLPGMVGLNNITETEFLTWKIWHARNFKGQVSPHEFLQAVMKASKKRFRIGVQSDPVEFMYWLLNTLHTNLKGSKKNSSSIIHKCFQGELEVVKDIQVKASAEREDGQNNNEIVAKDGTERPTVVTVTS